MLAKNETLEALFVSKKCDLDLRTLLGYFRSHCGTVKGILQMTQQRSGSFYGSRVQKFLLRLFSSA